MGSVLGSVLGSLLGYEDKRKEIEDLNDENDDGTESVSHDNNRRGEEKSVIGRERSAEERLELLTPNEGTNGSSCEPNTSGTKDIHKFPHHESEKYKSAMLLHDRPYPRPFRYATYVDKWCLTERNWSTLLDCISTSEAEVTKKFIFDKDKRMALGSRLLHRKVACESFGMDWKDVKIERRKGYKPVLRYCRAPKAWNMNVSHHGGMVAIASNSHRLCGVDTMDLTDGDRHCNSLKETETYLKCFQDTFTSFEWSYINGLHQTHHMNRDRVQRFLIQWSMKEAYVKAIGEGLFFDLLRVEFEGSGDDPNRPTSAIVRVDGQELTDWDFHLQYIGKHVLCVALGGGSSSSNEAYEESDGRDFELITLSDILPRSIAGTLE